MSAKITISINNNRLQLGGDVVILNKLREHIKVRHPNAFFLREHMPRGWDGYMRAITENATSKSGWFPKIIEYLEDNNISYKVTDHRRNLPSKFKVPKEVGKLTLRPYQYDAVSSVINNVVGGVPFPFGGLKMATNAGKTLMMAAIHKSIPGAKSLMIINDGDLFEQFKTELPELLGDDVGFVRGQKEQGWDKPFVVGMAKTISMNVNDYKYILGKFDVILVDEYDLASNKTYKSILRNCWNASVKVGLSGTVFMGKLAKDKIKHFEVREFFAELLYEISKKELVEKGVSANLVIKIIPCLNGTRIGGDWQLEYYRNITTNNQRLQLQVDRMKMNMRYGRLPALVFGRYHEHVENMYEAFTEAFPKLSIKYVHGNTSKVMRNKIINDFRTGKIDILVGSYILTRGKNFPLIKYIQQASGSDSAETISQIMGRGERNHKSKNKTVIDDFYDAGIYLEKHSKHRINYYKDEGFKVINLLKDRKTIKIKQQYGKSKKGKERRSRTRR